MEKALDVSNYSGAFGAEAVACWQEQGYRHLVCGTQRPEITRRQLETALAGGLSVAAYVYLYWRHDVVAAVQRSLAALEGLPVERLWLDCEDVRGALSAEDVVERIAAAVAACGAFPHGIYTGRWWWTPNTDESAAFRHLPLWHAEYTGSPSTLPDFGRFLPYGGWSRPAMWQYQGTTALCGVSVDLNLREAVALQAPPPLTQEQWELQVLRAGQRFLRALHGGRYALRPFAGRPDSVELVRVVGGEWQPFEPPYEIPVD